MESQDIPRVPYPEHPNRCQAITSTNQCLNMAVEGGTYCIIHGGKKQLNSQKAASLRNYRLSKWQARLERFADSPNLKSLRDEVGILRMLLEERLNACHSATDLVFMSGPISDLVIKIDKTVNSCHKLENVLGQHLDKVALMQFAGQIIEIIGENVEDSTIIDNIATGILGILQRDEDAVSS